MTLIPIDVDEAKNERLRLNPSCAAVLDMYPAFYKRVGFNPPWIGYMATIDGNEVIGCGGYKYPPKNGTVEIAYGAFQEGRGYGTQICFELVRLALKTDPSLRITARTLMDNNASQCILKRNGFVQLGAVIDEEDGEVYEWEFDRTAIRESVVNLEG